MHKRKKNKVRRVFLFINYILSIIMLLMCLILNILPLKYLIIIFIGVIIFNLILTICLFKKKKLGYVLSTIFILLSCFITYYLATTYNFLSYFNKDNYKTETFLVLALKDNNYDKLDDLENLDIGYVKNEITSIDKALDKLNNKIKIENIEYENYNLVFEDMISKSLASSLIEESNYNMILEENPTYEDLFKIIDKIKIITKIDNRDSNINVTNDTFNILISGIDTSGDISSVGRSDVNMILTVNPKTGQILMTSIPRDYYVRLHNTSGYKDKLTHSGIYGIEMTIDTIEDLLDIDISYYFRVNFTTLENIIDAIGGVDVYSKYSFISYIGSYQFYEGYNHMNGEQALGFARERKTLPNGDINRAENQQAVIDGIIRKLTKFSSITKYSSVINSLKDCFQTNMSDDDITSLIKMQLNSNINWNITSNVLKGEGASEYTYSYKGSKLYVMIPDTDSINNAVSLINKVKNGELLDSSYDEEASNVKNPNKVYTNSSTNNEDKKEETIKEPEDTIEDDTTIVDDEIPEDDSLIDDEIPEDDSQIDSPNIDIDEDSNTQQTPDDEESSNNDNLNDQITNQNSLIKRD